MPGSVKIAIVKFGISALCLFSVAGCHLVTPPNPNDPVVIANDPDRMLRNIEFIGDSLDYRMATGEITQEQKDAYMRAFVSSYTSKIDPTKIDPAKAWKYGDVYRSAGDWNEAYRLYRVAVDAASTEDRRVNDRLKLARTAAMLGKVDEAISMARSTFDAPPTDKAPILPAVLFEIVPAAQGKGKDVELARLLEDAVAQHNQTIVDPRDEAGARFMNAKTTLVRRAWQRALVLYQASSDPNLAREALARYEAAMSMTARA